MLSTSHSPFFEVAAVSEDNKTIWHLLRIYCLTIQYVATHLPACLCIWQNHDTTANIMLSAIIPQLETVAVYK